jgi:predicted transcriptional regulator
MRDPTMKFALSVELLLALQELARKRNQSVSRVLRNLVREATREGRKAGNPNDEPERNR